MHQVRFHFPCDSIYVDDVDPLVLNQWRTSVRNGHVFTVQQGKRSYTINPAMLTYVEVSDQLPF